VRLYAFWRSTASWRVRIALAYKGTPFELAPVRLTGSEQHADAYRAVNAMAQVPTLVLDDGRALSQSLAILEYLEETIPSPALLPRDPWLRARARQLAEIVNSGIQPHQNLGPLQRLRGLGVDDDAWARHFIERGLDGLAVAAEETAGAFLVGDAPTFADVCLVPQLTNARRHGLDVARWPLLSRVERTCDALEAFQVARPERQPDFVA
jgi:maleylpyruvate isomerase